MKVGMMLKIAISKYLTVLSATVQQVLYAETPLYEHRIIESWGEVAGIAAERMTKDLRIFNQVLHVSLRSAALRNELLYRRTELVKKLNDKVGADVIRDIVFS